MRCPQRELPIVREAKKSKSLEARKRFPAWLGNIRHGFSLLCEKLPPM
jgi:hypothetical protein